MKKLTMSLVAVLILVMGLTAVASAQTIPTVPYTIKRGDTLSNIAREFCTTWQDVYEFNKGYIGDNPNDIESGTQIYIIDRCQNNNVFDRGIREHAIGRVYNGNIYVVEQGDTLYSIGLRFGLNWHEIAYANGMTYPSIDKGMQLVIPGLNEPDTPELPNPNLQPNLTITSPRPGAVLDGPYVVSGTGQGLPEGNVVVRLLDGNNEVMAEQATVLQGENAGTGGYGTWQVTFHNIYGQPKSNGAVEATNPETGVSTTTAIWFSGQ